MRAAAFALLIGVMTACLLTVVSPARACLRGELNCPGKPEVSTGNGSLEAAYFAVVSGVGVVSGTAPTPQSYTWRVLTPCQISDATTGGCAQRQPTCTSPADRVVFYAIVQSKRLVAEDASAVDGLAPPPGVPAGTPYGQWVSAFAGCVDIPDLNPPPSPDEVYRYFQTLPLSQLATRQQ